MIESARFKRSSEADFVQYAGEKNVIDCARHGRGQGAGI